MASSAVRSGDSLGATSARSSSTHLNVHRFLPAFLRVNLPSTHRIQHHRIKSKNGAADPPSDDAALWKESAFPHYMQETVEASDFCSILEEAKARQKKVATGEHRSDSSGVWRAICRETEQDARAEPLLSSFLYASILSHDSFERSLAFVLSNRLSDATLLPTELFEVFYTVLKSNRHIAEAALADLCAVRERDPACGSYAHALLYFKGYHAIQVQRIAHSLWHAGRRVMALALQSRSSEVLAVDIHPAAKIGKGVLLDHGTGVVIGETAEVGNNVSILQNVTLGGTGKEHGDRHPKVSDNVLIGASATILGNIRIGKGAQVAAGSLVLKAVPPKTMVAGSPAKEVGHVSGNPAQKMDQWSSSSSSPSSSSASKGRFVEACDDPFASASAAAAAAAAGISGNAVPMPAPPSPPPPQRTAAAEVVVVGLDAKTKRKEDAEDIDSEWKSSAEAAEKEAAMASSTSTQQQHSNSNSDSKAATPQPSSSSSQSVKKVTSGGRQGAPPPAAEPVEAVTTDSAAKKKWGAGKGDGNDVEYFI